MKRTRSTLFLAVSLSLVSARSSGGGSYGDWVAAHFTPAQSEAGLASPLCDHDGDLCPNLLEYLGGTHPMDASSTFALGLGFDPVLEEVTVSFPTEAGHDDIEHLLLVSHDLVAWSPAAVFVRDTPSMTYHLNGHQYVRVGARPRTGTMFDSDNDGLSDFYEESLVSSDPGRGFTHIGQILPGDDFDDDGILNIDEEANGPVTATFTKPATLDPAVVTSAMDTASSPSPTTLVVHTVLN